MSAATRVNAYRERVLATVAEHEPPPIVRSVAARARELLDGLAGCDAAFYAVQIRIEDSTFSADENYRKVERAVVSLFEEFQEHGMTMKLAAGELGYQASAAERAALYRKPQP